MSQITWKNVNAPDFSGALAAGHRASEQMGKALDPLKTMLTDAQARDEANFKNAGEQTTRGLEAQLRNATSIGDLDQRLNPEGLQQYGVLANQERLRAVGKEQEGLLRTRNTDDLLANSQAPGSFAEITARQQGLNNREVDLDRLSKTWGGQLEGQETDKRIAQENTAYLEQQAGIAEEKDITQGVNSFLEQRKMNVPHADATKTVLGNLDPKTSKSKTLTQINAASIAEYDLDPAAKEAIGDHDRRAEITGQQIETVGAQRIAVAQAEYEEASKAGLSPAMEAEAASLPGGAIQHIHGVVGGRLIGDGGMDVLEETGKQLAAAGHNPADINALIWQGWNSTAKGKDTGWWRQPKVVQQVLDNTMLYAQNLPHQRAAAGVVREMQQRAQDEWLTHFENSQFAREGIAKNSRQGTSPQTPAGRILEAGRTSQQPGDLSEARLRNMENNRPTVNGEKLPEGASVKQFVGAWNEKVNEVLGTSGAFAGSPTEAVSLAMKATHTIESNNGKNVGNKSYTRGDYQIQQARAADMGITLEQADDPATAEKATKDWYTTVGVPTLQRANLPVTPANLFLTWNQGATGGVEILLAANSEEPDTRADAAAVLQPEKPVVTSPQPDVDPEDDALEKRMEGILKAAAGKDDSQTVGVGGALKEIGKSVLLKMGEDTTARKEQMARARQKKDAQREKDNAWLTNLAGRNQARSVNADSKDQLDKLDRRLIAGTITKDEYRKKYKALTK